MIYTQSLILDVNAAPTKQVIYGKVGDTNRRIMVEVVSDGVPYPLSGSTVSLRIGKYSVSTDITSVTSIATLPIDESMMVEACSKYGDIALVKDGAVLSTAPFEFIVLESPKGELEE